MDKTKEHSSSTDIKLSTSNFISEKLGNIKDHYKITSCIGKGAYGEVRKC